MNVSSNLFVMSKGISFHIFKKVHFHSMVLGDLHNNSAAALSYLLYSQLVKGRVKLSVYVICELKV